MHVNETLVSLPRHAWINVPSGHLIIINKAQNTERIAMTANYKIDGASVSIYFECLTSLGQPAYIKPLTIVDEHLDMGSWEARLASESQKEKVEILTEAALSLGADESWWFMCPLILAKALGYLPSQQHFNEASDVKKLQWGIMALKKAQVHNDQLLKLYQDELQRGEVCAVAPSCL